MRNYAQRGHRRALSLLLHPPGCCNSVATTDHKPNVMYNITTNNFLNVKLNIRSFGVTYPKTTWSV